MPIETNLHELLMEILSIIIAYGSGLIQLL